DMPARLREMRIQRLLQLRIVRMLLELRDHLEDRAFHLQRGAELVHVQVARRLDRAAKQCHKTPFRIDWDLGYPAATRAKRPRLTGSAERHAVSSADRGWPSCSGDDSSRASAAQVASA